MLISREKQEVIHNRHKILSYNFIKLLYQTISGLIVLAIPDLLLCPPSTSLFSGQVAQIFEAKNQILKLIYPKLVNRMRKINETTVTQKYSKITPLNSLFSNHA
jgi:hypothetical protein